MASLFPNVTSTNLGGLINTTKARGMRVGLEIGGVRWGDGRCDTASQLRFAKQEQMQVQRWLSLGGSIDSITTDHACTWDIRHELHQSHCSPPVPLTTRIDTVAQVLASWRQFLGLHVSIGFIESLGYWDILGPDGTMYYNVSPDTLNNITGWIPRLENVTALLLSAGKKYNPSTTADRLRNGWCRAGHDHVRDNGTNWDELRSNPWC
eukprot:m.10101 g.10101  ORF g.10101 m.10101 type:complete len:208 (+) comp4270_c0_seq1:290-913(+)